MVMPVAQPEPDAARTKMSARERTALFNAIARELARLFPNWIAGVLTGGPVDPGALQLVGAANVDWRVITAHALARGILPLLVENLREQSTDDVWPDLVEKAARLQASWRLGDDEPPRPIPTPWPVIVAGAVIAVLLLVIVVPKLVKGPQVATLEPALDTWPQLVLVTPQPKSTPTPTDVKVEDAKAEDAKAEDAKAEGKSTIVKPPKVPVEISKIDPDPVACSDEIVQDLKRRCSEGASTLGHFTGSVTFSTGADGKLRPVGAKPSNMSDALWDVMKAPLSSTTACEATVECNL